MNPVSPWPAVVALLLAMLSARVLVIRYGNPPTQGRFPAVDGLRGYLAFAVFLNHSAVWYFYLRTGRWENPPSQLYVHFGQSSVVLFFMITGFLFTWKLIGRAGGRRTDTLFWLQLYVSRVCRLVPLYLIATLVLFIMVACVTQFHLNEPIVLLVRNALKWILFTAPGAMNLNGYPETSVILAVTWSLPYEWLFYFSLPVLAAVFRVEQPWWTFLLSVLAAVGWVMWRQPELIFLIAFLGGIVAAFCVRSKTLTRLGSGAVGSVLALACFALSIGLFKGAYNLTAVFLLSIGFIIITLGNSFFGLLKSSFSKMLGEVSYGIYLLHCLLLFALFRFGIGFETARGFSSLTHWAVICCTVPVLIFVCHATFRLIEKPAITAGPRISSKLARLVRMPLKERVPKTVKAVLSEK